jgi:osmotically-inducible protein OsmY
MSEEMPMEQRVSGHRAAPWRRSDDRIRDEVVAELSWDGRIADEANLKVLVKDGIVTITGPVDTFMQRHAIVQAAERVRGVRRVIDATSIVLRRLTPALRPVTLR